MEKSFLKSAILTAVIGGTFIFSSDFIFYFLIKFLKTMCKFSFFIALLVLTQSTFLTAQTLTGKITNKEGAPVPFANILVKKVSDSSFVKGDVVKDDGTFNIGSLPFGVFFCETSLVGYAKKTSREFKFENVGDQTNVGNIVLVENTEIGVVEIKTTRAFIEQKIDRTVVNVANSITNAGSNALEVLKRSPGVQVNLQSNTIALAGKQGVVIMINGKITQMPDEAIVQMLQGVNSDNIDRIELIHTPPANFAADGNAGIINIVLKSTNNDGFNGGYSANVGMGRNEKYGYAANFNFRKKILNIFGNYSYDYDLNSQVFSNYRGVYQSKDFLETDVVSNRFHPSQGTGNARFGADFQISPKTVIGVLGTYTNSNWEMDAVNDVTYSKNGVFQSKLSLPNHEINQNQSYTGNINFSHQITKSQTLNVDADIIGININNPSTYSVLNVDANNFSKQLYGLSISKHTPINVKVISADYTNSVNDKFKLDFGAKFTYYSFNNDIRTDSLTQRSEFINLIDYTSLTHFNEKVGAAYMSFLFKPTKTLEIKAGLRYEYTITNIGSDAQPNQIDRKYGEWFPSLYLVKTLTETQSLNVSYSRRTTRPKLFSLASFLIYLDPTTLLGGNPKLQPAYTNAFKIDYGYKAYHISVSYSDEANSIGATPIVDVVTNKQINTWTNLSSTKVANTNLFLPLHPTTWWEMQNNIYLSYTEINFILDNQNISNNLTTYGFNSTQTFNLPKKWSLEVSGNYDGPSYYGIVKFNATKSISAGIQKDFGEKWGKLRLNVQDIFEGSNWLGSVNIPDKNLNVRADFIFAERLVRLSYTNTFGNTKLKSARRHESGSEEKQRTQ